MAAEGRLPPKTHRKLPPWRDTLPARIEEGLPSGRQGGQAVQAFVSARPRQRNVSAHRAKEIGAPAERLVVNGLRGRPAGRPGRTGRGPA